MMVMQGGSMTRRLMLIASAATLLLASAPAMADYLVLPARSAPTADLMAQGPGGRPTAAVHGLVAVSIPSGLAARRPHCDAGHVAPIFGVFEQNFGAQQAATGRHSRLSESGERYGEQNWPMDMR